MGTKKVPESYLHTCDGCGATQQHDRVSRPKYWSDLTLSRDAYDYQGCAVADGSVSRLLCDKCTEKVTSAINAALARTPQESEND